MNKRDFSTEMIYIDAISKGINVWTSINIWNRILHQKPVSVQYAAFNAGLVVFTVNFSAWIRFRGI